jgi:hypothetical protein
MTIILSEEQTRLLSEVVQAGAARSAEEAVDQALRTLHSSATSPSQGASTVGRSIDNLADLFAGSPFRGLNIEFERDRDLGRDIPL